MKPLNPYSIPKYITQLTIPPVFKPALICDQYTGQIKGLGYTVRMEAVYEQCLPAGFPKSKVWGFGGIVEAYGSQNGYCCCCSPGPAFEVTRGIPAYVTWINNLSGSLDLPVDPTLHWANPNRVPPPKLPFVPFPPGYPWAQKPVPVVIHLHGGETPSAYDGHAEAWFTADGRTGPAYVTNSYIYPNTQQPTALWYHEHTLGTTRLGIYSGLAGMYFVRDPSDPVTKYLPGRENEIPLNIQDRSFNTDGSLLYAQEGDLPNIHPYWAPDFFGNTVMVNGRVWPNLNVKPQQYRFRILNGSNERFYHIRLSNQQPFIRIGSDGGYLPYPTELSSLLISPAERADILIDFSHLKPGTKIIMTNDANTPFPNGTSPDPQTDGQIMQFTVTNDQVIPPKKLPPVLNIMPELVSTKTRILPIYVISQSGKTVILLLNGQRWFSPISELPRIGTTEDWIFPNFSKDSHPIHVHLIQFLLVSRQKFRAADYERDWLALNKDTPPGAPPYMGTPKELPVAPYLQGEPMPPPAAQSGWMDTVNINPGEVTIIRIRFAPQNGYPFPFDPSIGPGYVWHCHMLEHEDNELMRPFKLMP